MRKLIAVLVALVGLVFVPNLQAQNPSNSSLLHNVGGFYVASAYNTWRAQVAGGPFASGAVTISMASGVVSLADGYTFVPFSTSVPIIVGLGTANQETVTPSAVSGCTQAASVSPPSCLVTATFSNSHGQGDIVVSGSAGIQDAIQDAANSGGGDVYFQVDCGNVTLNTGGATTTTTCNVPTSYVGLGGSAFVKTTITTAASYSLGTAAKTTGFINACTSLTAGTSCAAFAAAASPVNSTGTSTANTALLITANATPGAGVVHVRAWGYVPVQSNN